MNRKSFITISIFGMIFSCGGGNSTYFVSGKVQGLDGSLTIQNNGKDDITIEKDGEFTIKFPLSNNETFDVQTYREPCAQRCKVKNGSGTIGSENITDIEINCVVKEWSQTKNFLQGTPFENGDITVEDIAMNKKGDSIVIWKFGAQLYKSERRNGEWIHPDVSEYLGYTAIESKSAKVAMNNKNQAIIIWSMSDYMGSPIYHLYMSEYRNGFWSKPLLSDYFDRPYAGSGVNQLVMNDLGDVIVIWEQGDSEIGASRTYKSEFRNSKWSHPVDKNDSIGSGAKVALNNSGQAIIVWHEYRESEDRTDLFKIEYINDSWSKPSYEDAINPDDMSVISPDVKLNDSGDALIFWNSHYSTPSFDLYKAERRDNIWNFPKSKDDRVNPPGSNPYRYSFSLADNGNALVTWYAGNTYEWGHDYRLFRAVYQNKQWDWPKDDDDYFVSTEDYLNDFVSSMDNQGNAMLLWTFYNTIDPTSTFKQEFTNNRWGLSKIVDSNISSPILKSHECRQLIFWNPNYGTYETKTLYFQEYK